MNIIVNIALIFLLFAVCAVMVRDIYHSMPESGKQINTKWLGIMIIYVVVILTALAVSNYYLRDDYQKVNDHAAWKEAGK